MSKGLNLHTGDGIIAKDPDAGILLAYGTTVPSDAAEGYSPGCLFQQTDGSGEATYLYVNVGTKASANFDAIDLNVAEMALLSGLTVNAALLNLLTGLSGTTGTEINRSSDMSARVVDCTASTLSVTEADHDGRIIVLDRAAGIDVTLPVPAAGMRFEFIVKTTFTGAASIKSVAGTHVMIGHALMGNDTDNTTVLWQALAASTYDTIDLFGTANSTGGIAGQRIVIIGLSTTRWHVEITGDAAGTEATPFADTVA